MNKVKWVKKTQGTYYHSDGTCVKKGQIIEATKEELGSFANLFRQVGGGVPPLEQETEAETVIKPAEVIKVDIADLEPIIEQAEEEAEQVEEVEEEEEDIFGEEEEDKVTYSLKQAGRFFFVINDSTKEKMNPKGLSKEEAEELLKELQNGTN